MARLGDAEVRHFLCELCRLRAQGAVDETSAASLMAMRLERLRLLTIWNAQADDTINGVGSATRRLRELDRELPEGVVPSLEPEFAPYWPEPKPQVSLAWHMLRLSREGGRGDHGERTVGSLKPLRGALFNQQRELALDNDAMIRLQGGHLQLPGSIVTESLGFEQFHSGLRVRMGEKSIQAWPMPASVALGLEELFVEYYISAQGAKAQWAKLYAAGAALANDIFFSCWLRGTEPWGIKLAAFERELYLDAPCPHCNKFHVGVPLTERTKNDPGGRGFDLLTAAVTGAGLRVGDAARRYLEIRRQLPTNSPYLFVREDGKQWDTKFFWGRYVMPGLRALSARGHPGVVGLPWDVQARLTIRVYRRGAEKFAKKAKVDNDLLDLMGRWRPKTAFKDPAIMRQRYYELDCADLYEVTAAKPPPMAAA